MSRSGKVTVVGAGFYGSTTALRLAEYDIFETVVLTDILEGKPEGLALDMNQSRSIEGFETKIVGATTTVDGDPERGADLERGHAARAHVQSRLPAPRPQEPLDHLAETARSQRRQGLGPQIVEGRLPHLHPSALLQGTVAEDRRLPGTAAATSFGHQHR